MTSLLVTEDWRELGFLKLNLTKMKRRKTLGLRRFFLARSALTV
jgi:hypothetical protein